MRRLLLFVALLALTGLTTAFASSFAVETEDVASFTPDVSISIPTTTVPLPPVLTFVVQGEADPSAIPGTLSLEVVQANVKSRLILLDTKTVQAQDDPAKYHMWQTSPVSGEDLTVGGRARLYIEQKDEAGSLLTAGLFVCPEGAGSASTADSGCIPLGLTAVGSGPTNSGYSERIADFGTIPTTVISDGFQLRLKVVNRDKADDGAVVSTANWDLAWGYLPARKARLEFQP